MIVFLHRQDSRLYSVYLVTVWHFIGYDISWQMTFCFYELLPFAGKPVVHLLCNYLSKWRAGFRYMYNEYWLLCWFPIDCRHFAILCICRNLSRTFVSVLNIENLKKSLCSVFRSHWTSNFVDPTHHAKHCNRNAHLTPNFNLLPLHRTTRLVYYLHTNFRTGSIGLFCF